MVDVDFAELDHVTVQQLRASRPQSSAWVSANAGSGKTHVLAQRVIRLLLAGARPSSILCLTYTKAAASEMSNRIFSRLAEWARLSDDELSAEISALERRPVRPGELAGARRLFSRALETPGGLKIQTIHAFCEAVLHQFPLEANVPGHFEILDELKANQLLEEARQGMIQDASKPGNSDLASALETILDAVGEFGFDGLLDDIVSNRAQLRDFLRDAESPGTIDETLRKALQIADDLDEERVLSDVWPLPGLSPDRIAAYCAVAWQATSRPKAHAAAFQRVVETPEPDGRFALLNRLLLKDDGQPYKPNWFVTKPIQEKLPEAEDWIGEAQNHLLVVDDQLRKLRTLEATRAVLVLADALLSSFERKKRRAGYLDYDDLIERTASLLQKSDAGAWVHFKLDQGIDHILVDEAQDTSPRQWSVIQSLASDFFAGESARNLERTEFAVGDEKQSIYSFQGARPDRFVTERVETERKVRNAAGSFENVKLRVSFRSTADVLSAVDAVFADPLSAKGLSFENEPVVHASNRPRDRGEVQLWEQIVAEDDEDPDDWEARFEVGSKTPPAAKLAERIATVLAEWVGQEMLMEKGQQRPIRPGDVLVLVRKRGPFVQALTRELKTKTKIPVAGTDRLHLSDHIAIQDLIAIGRFVLSPDDDLSLAALFKSPLLNLSEAQLMHVAIARQPSQTLFRSLLEMQDDDPEFTRTADYLRSLIGLASTHSVHDFYAEILGHLGGRRAFFGRYGSEVNDVLDEFIAFAIEHQKVGELGLQVFISAIEDGSPEIKREQEQTRDEVRIMTVHASKGMEAPVVFLVDPGGDITPPSFVPKFRFVGRGSTRPKAPIWIGSKQFENRASQTIRDQLLASAEDEYRRLLYVGMTRAADRLIVCGYRGRKVPRKATWHAIVKAGLEDHGLTDESEIQIGSLKFSILRHRLTASGSIGEEIEDTPTLAEASQIELPPSLFQPLPEPVQLPRPLSPSGAGTILEDARNDIIGGGLLFDAAATSKDDAPLQRGKALHRLLQVLPDLDRSDRHGIAERYLSRALPAWGDTEREALAANVLELLNDRRFAHYFQKHARAEVAVLGTVKLRGEARAVSGRIDRLIIEPDRVVILDYKTHTKVPEHKAQIPDAYWLQMALYREILKPLYPDREIEAALLFTGGPTAIELSSAELASSLERLTTK